MNNRYVHYKYQYKYLVLHGPLSDSIRLYMNYFSETKFSVHIFGLTITSVNTQVLSDKTYSNILNKEINKCTTYLTNKFTSDAQMHKGSNNKQFHCLCNVQYQ